MSILDIAQQRKGKLRDGYSANKAGISVEETRVEYGTAQADSADGYVEIQMDNSDESFEVPCDSPISSGDRVSYISTNGYGKAVSLATLTDTTTGLTTIVREFSGGVLVAKVGNSVGALVNANGTFDVVSLTWSGDNPSITGTLATFGQTIQIKTPNGSDYGYFEFDDDGALTIKRYENGAFAPSYFEVDAANAEITLDNADGYGVLKAATESYAIGNKCIVGTNYKYAGPTDTDPTLYVSSSHTTPDASESYYSFEALPIFKIIESTYTTGSIAVSSGVSGSMSIASDVPSGYKPVGIVGVKSNHGQNWYSNDYLDGTTLTYNIKHAFGSGAERCTLKWRILCVPSGNVG